MIGLVIATHGTIASAIAAASEIVLGAQDALSTVDLPANANGDDAWGMLRDAVTAADRGEGVLIMVDMLGGTPSNLSMAMLAREQIEVLTGVNLPMVLRALRQRPGQDLTELATEVSAYGQRNITVASDWLRPASKEGK